MELVAGSKSLDGLCELNGDAAHANGEAESCSSAGATLPTIGGEDMVPMGSDSARSRCFGAARHERA